MPLQGSVRAAADWYGYRERLDPLSRTGLRTISSEQLSFSFTRDGPASMRKLALQLHYESSSLADSYRQA